MVNQTQIRTMLASKLFSTTGSSAFGKIVTHRTQSKTYDEREEVVGVTNTDASIAIVPYDISKDRLEYEGFSAFNPGDFFAAVPYTVTIAPKDLIIMESITWEVKEVVPHYLPDNLVTVIRLSKVAA